MRPPQVTQFAPADQLAAQLMKIRVAQAYAPDGKVPTDVRTVALQTATKMLDGEAGCRTCAPAW